MAVEDPHKVIRPKETQAAGKQELLAANIRNALQAKKGHPKLESALQQLYTAAPEQGPIAAQGLSQRQGIRDVRGQIQVIVEMEPELADLVSLQADNGTSRHRETEGLRRRRGLLKQQIEAAGITPEAEYRHLVRVRVSPDHLVQLADMPGVRSVQLPQPLVPAVVSEGIALTGATSNYHANGFTGTGVTVAVIDGGFMGLQNAITNDELPSSIITRDCTVGTTCPAVSVAAMETGSVHGTAVAEVVYDMAPGINLWLFKAPTLFDLGNATDVAIANGVNIINLSGVFPGDGFVEGVGASDVIANDARAQGVLWVNSAGNSANGDHWRGQFVDNADALGSGLALHEFVAGVDETNEFQSSAFQPFQVVLTWNDWPGSNQDYDLILCTSTFAQCFVSDTIQNGSQDPYESISLVFGFNVTWEVLILKKTGTNGTATFELYKNGTTGPFEHSVADHSILPPADATGAIAVGAIDEDNWTTGPQGSFSSQGPTNDGRIKPDIMGPNCAANFTLHSTGCFDGGGFPGTSASAPHVAGALALLKQANPSMTPTQLENLLYANAVDMGAGGFDNIFGRGRLQLPAPSSLGVSVNPATWAIGAIAPGATVRMNEANDVAVTNAGNVAETMTLRIANPGTAWAPGLGAGTESFHLQGLFVGSADAPGPSNFQADDTLLSGAPVEATATQFGMASGGLGFNPDAGGALTNNLLAYWKLDEPSGTRVDSAGANDLADNNTVTQAAGIQGNAAQFTAANSEYLSVADHAALSMGDFDFTIACWVYMDTVDAVRTILQKGTGGSLTFDEYQLFQANAGDTFKFAVGDGVGDNNIIDSGVVPTVGTWNFIAAWHDAAANTINIQINNGSVASGAWSGGSHDGTGPLTIGRRVDGTRYWNGRVEEVGIWKRVLTAQNRADLYHGGLGNTLNPGGTNGAGVPPGGVRDLWLSFTGPTHTTQSNQESIVVEVGVEQTP